MTFTEKITELKNRYQDNPQSLLIIGDCCRVFETEFREIWGLLAAKKQSKEKKPSA
jgi:hypothetical protein